jgi:hypothetical protein
MNQHPTDFEMTMESIRFFAWLIGSIVTGAVALVGIYLRLYIHDALQSHAIAIQKITALHYVRKDVHDQEIRRLESMIEGLT